MARLSSRWFRIPAATSFAALLLIASACSNDANARAINATAGGDSTSGEGKPDTKIEWKACTGAETGNRCADVTVPLDYDEPDGDTITLGVTLAKATGNRIGPLFINPGGPGSTADDLVAQLSHFLPDEIIQRFDIVGVDPRGTGASKLACGFDMTKLFGTDPYVDNAEERQALVDVNKDYTDACQDEVGDLLPHMGTRDAARDIDRIRELLGDEKMSYLGMSYGTILGQVYAAEFPDRVRAMVLDASVPLGPTGIELATTQAAGFETALEAFAKDCNAKADCPIAPDAIDSIDKLLARTEKEPIPAKPRDLGPGEVATGLSLPLYSQDMWPDLAKAVAAGLKGDGSPMVKLADTYLGEVDFDLYYAVNCIDFEWPSSTRKFITAADTAGETDTHFGQPEVNQYLECATWPVDQDPLEASSQPISPRPLVIATTGDPATPYDYGKQTAEQTGGLLLTHLGEGHTSVGEGDECIDPIVAAYLVDGKLPADGTTCD